MVATFCKIRSLYKWTDGVWRC